MKLNVQILLDDIIGQYSDATPNKESDLYLLGIRMIPLNDKAPFLPEYIYLGTTESFIKRNDFSGLKAAAFIGDEKKIPHQFIKDAEIIYIPECNKLEDIFEKFQEIFTKYEKWNNELFTAVLDGKDIQTVSDIGVKVFRNPFAILDSATDCLARSGSIPADYQNPIWDMLFASNYAMDSDLNRILNERTDNSIGFRKDAILLKDFSYGKDTKTFDVLMTNIFHGGKRVGNFGMTQVYEPISEGQCRLSEYFSAVISYLFVKEKFADYNSDPLNQTIINLLSGRPYSPDMLNTYIKFFGKKANYIYRIYKIGCYDNEINKITPINEEYMHSHIKYLTSTKSQKDVVVSFNGSLIYIEAVPEDKNNGESKIKEIEAFICKAKLVLGVSNTFKLISDLYQYYLQADAAVRIGTNESPEKKVYYYSDYAIDHLIDVYLENFPPEVFCHSDVIKLHKYDLENHTAFLPTVETFYLFSGNHARAAEAMHVHRNSLVYRLEKIKEILGVGEYCVESSLYFLLSCKMIQHSNTL